MNVMEQAKAKRAEQIRKAEEEKERKKNGYSGGDFEQPEYMGLEENKEKVFRILGFPYMVRQNPTDTQLILYSKILDDANGETRIVWKQDESNLEKPDSNWILTRIHDKVTEFKWNNPPKGTLDKDGKPAKGERVFTYEGTKSYEWVKNSRKENAKFPLQFYPSRRVNLNVIDRHDTWCKDNKHSKLLSNSHNPFESEDPKTHEKKTIWFTEPGIPLPIFNNIFDQVVEFRGDWKDLDVVVKRYKDSSTNDTVYSVRDLKEEKISKDSKTIGSAGPLSEEEQAYELYDLDKLFKVASYQKLLKRFEKRIKQVDIDCGTHFYEELVEYAAKEKAEYEARKAEEDANSTEKSETKSEVETKVEQSKEEPIVDAPPKRRSQEQNQSLSLEDQIKTSFPKFDSLKSIEKQELLKSIDKIDGQNISYKAGVNIMPCEKNCETQILLPDSVLTCLRCGKGLS